MPEREPGREPRSAAEVAGDHRHDDPKADAADGTGQAATDDDSRTGAGANAMARGYARAEEKNQQVREALVPLAPGERPGAVTVGSVFAGLVATVFWVSLAIRLFTNVEIEGRQPDPVQLILFAVVMTAMAVGMWRMRYWAVLGFQMLLVLFLLAATLGLMTAETLIQALATAALIAIAGFIFYKMIKVMARIQMPERRPPH